MNETSSGRTLFLQLIILEGGTLTVLDMHRLRSIVSDR